jgi:hypothetical protein
MVRRGGVKRETLMMELLNERHVVITDRYATIDVSRALPSPWFMND